MNSAAGAAQPTSPTSQLSVGELVKLCAVDSELYAKSFFPRTFRVKSPSFAPLLWEPLENPKARLVNLICFRGSSKTTRLRTFASKRIAYGISRTILYVGAAESDAIRSVQWLRTQVEKNTFWAKTFGLGRGRKWEETLAEITHATLGHSIWVTAAGINGSLRGINFDDYRPDLIVIDDPQTDETAATLAQREKISDLILGAVRNSLSQEEPNAKMAMAITPQHREDVSQQALKDSEYTSVVVPCWTKATMDLDVEQQESSWEEMFPTPQLRSEKRAALARNKLSIFTREKECRLTSVEMAQFRSNWLCVRSEPAPRGLYCVLAIDPVPPPSPRQMASGLQGKDFEVHQVWGRENRGGGEVRYHLLESARNRGHEPSWTVATAFALARNWRASRIIVEAVGYQRTIKWMLEQEMRRRGIYYSVVPVTDSMQKFARITGALSGLASSGQLWIGSEHTDFAQQFAEYGPTYSGHDDDLDCAAIALTDLANPYLERLDESGNLRDDEVEDLPMVWRCP